MVNYWNLVNRVLATSDILLLVIDSRFPDLTRHREIESKVSQRGKKLLYVLNKSDLITKGQMAEIKKQFDPCVFVSSREHLGGTILFKKIMELTKGEPGVIGVLGYPNVGKSSVINMLKGQKSASVSPHSGHTHGIQFIRAKGKLKLIDTPGVLPFDEKDLLNQVIVGSKNPEHLKEPDYFAMHIIEKYPALLARYYGLEYKGDAFEFLEEAAKESKVLIRGGEPDLQRFARQLLYDWQRGKVHEAALRKI